MDEPVSVQSFINEHNQLPQIQHLVQQRLGFTLVDLLLRGDTLIEPMRLPQLISDCRRLEAGEPLAYILGEAEFYSRVFRVSADTLIPRPDSEHLVDLALKIGDELAVSGRTPKVCDLGTGSGCLSVSIALERPDWTVWATDLSAPALSVARHNAAALLAEVTFWLGDWFEALPLDARFDLIVSNPPYIDEDDEHLEQLVHEPMSALIASDAGLSDIEQLIDQAPDFLNPDGWLMIEHGYDQGAAVRALFDQSFTQVATLKDYGDNERVTYGQLKAQA